jgi:hypothetical protein
VVLSLLPSLAWADEVTPGEKAAEARIQEALIRPLAVNERERSKFSRARMPPRERRVRLIQASPSTDASGRTFYSFAIDSKFGAGWQENDLTGCVYAEGDVFVKKGDAHRPAEFLLGKSVKPVAGVCVAQKDGLAARL